MATAAIYQNTAGFPDGIDTQTDIVPGQDLFAGAKPDAFERGGGGRILTFCIAGEKTDTDPPILDIGNGSQPQFGFRGTDPALSFDEFIQIRPLKTSYEYVLKNIR